MPDNGKPEEESVSDAMKRMASSAGDIVRQRLGMSAPAHSATTAPPASQDVAPNPRLRLPRSTAEQERYDAHYAARPKPADFKSEEDLQAAHDKWFIKGEMDRGSTEEEARAALDMLRNENQKFDSGWGIGAYARKPTPK